MNSSRTGIRLVLLETRFTTTLLLALTVAGLGRSAPAPEAQTPAVPDPGAAAKPDLAPRAPLPPPGYMESCLALIEAKRFDEARRRLLPVVESHPGWARAQFYLALTYHMDHRYGAAREWFERALEVDPEYHTIRVYFGWCLYYLGELDLARAMFDAYLAVKPGYADAIFALGLIEFDEDDMEAARTRFVETIAIAQAALQAGTEAKARARLADVRIRNGEFEKARAELERSIELEPDNYEPYYKLSRVLERLGDAAGAAKARTRHDEVRAGQRPEPGRERYP